MEKGINEKGKVIATKLELEDRIFATEKRQASITVKDHKDNNFPNSVETSVQRSEEFHSGTGRDGIKVQSRDPGIFRDGISLIFQSRDCLEIVWDFSGLTFLIQLVII